MAISLGKSVTNTNLCSRAHWHQVNYREVAFFLDTDIETGLTSTEVEHRRAKFGWNEFTTTPRERAWLRFLLQFHQPLLYILLAAGAIKALVGSWTNAIVIWGIAALNAVISYVQESKVEGSIKALAQAVTEEARVVRSGQKLRIPARELIPGDVVLLCFGNKVPADLRLVSVHNLQVDESALTGQGVNVRKSTSSLSANTPVAARDNMAYAGSFVTSGQGRGIVVATGNNTELGRISQSLEQNYSLSTPLIRKFDKFSRTLLYIILVLASLTLVLGLTQGRTWTEMFEVAVALAVSAIPEGLPAVITITLIIGMARMVRSNAIIRKLPAIEMLGSATVICSDNTGALTENQMTVQFICAGEQKYTVSGMGYSLEGTIREIDSPQPIHFGGRFLNPVSTEKYSHPKSQYPTSNPALKECLIAGLLCNDAHLEPRQNQWFVVGDPTEGALVVVARKAGLSQSKLSEAMPRLDTIPFDSAYQYMATLHGKGKEDKRRKVSYLVSGASERTVYVKGSVEAILSRCQYILDAHGNVLPFMTNHENCYSRISVEREAQMLAKQGLRVLAFAKKSVETDCHSLTQDHMKSGLIFLGLQGMIDPPRKEVFPAIQACQSAGIQVKMMTGDNVTTAVAIAQNLGLHKDGELVVFEGQQLAQMSDRELKEAVETGVVFARVAPNQKLLLVEALQSRGEVVAMTGDGVKDAPVLKQADIGIAMGGVGTDVAREAADMLLVDDNFASIKAAVEEGRTVYQNLRKAIAFILPTNGGELMAILVSVLFAWELPILSLQILWLNMVNSIIMTVPLAFEPKLEVVMHSSPRSHREPMLSKQLLWRILLVSVFNCILILGVFEWVRHTMGDISLARTMAIQGLIAARIVYLLSISQWGKAIFAKFFGKVVQTNNLSHSFQTNTSAIAIGIVCTVILQILFSQWSLMNTLFETAPLSLSQWVICLIPILPAIALAVFVNRFDPVD
ncbi:MAG: HAD-IC family P-type ATPase [Scytonema sp. PMC 1069.18]|nr:HAD-IC family P-type ATPase [Scytonema sp. PMC 1069.18]MEC4884628.1 HAD-IC family P-type ATPase [Scytonema sp. PMC 1070.18]